MKKKILNRIMTLAIATAAMAMVFTPMQAMAAGKFDPDYYARTYEDVRNVFGTDAEALYTHYLMFGMAEGRVPRAGASAGEAVEGIADIQEVSSLKIDLTVDKWENIVPNKISTSIVGDTISGLSVGRCVPFRITMEVPAMQQENNMTLACRAVVTDTLPAGMSFNEGSLHVYVNGARVPATAYTYSVTGQVIQVTLNGINQYPFGAKEGDELVVIYNAVVDSTIEAPNENTASVQYEYGTFTRKWTREKEDKYSIYVCQYCGFRASSQSEVSDHQELFIYTDGIPHAMARGLVYDYQDWLYVESEFVVKDAYTIRSEISTATVYTADTQ